MGPERVPTRYSDGLPAPPGDAVPLVLGAGGSRGFAHLGVLKVLEEADLRPDIVVGASVGSVIAALYCAGFGTSELERMALARDQADLLEAGPREEDQPRQPRAPHPPGARTRPRRRRATPAPQVGL